MIMPLAAAALLLAAPTEAVEDFDATQVSEVDAINCKLDVPQYLSFALGLEQDGIARSRGWKTIKSPNSFMAEYELPEPVVVAGSHSTRRIAFTSDSILAILDVPDPAAVAGPEKVESALNFDTFIDEMVATGKVDRAQAEASIKFRKFIGERIISDEVEPAAEGQSFGSRMIVARTISNVTSHPGKTLFGCSYRFEMIDENGDRL
ncbi:hypothetical protein [Sphingosinicella sp. BN140058]|uniref:hypothetical protein n=1 Tax=Sphingosinicella sp. BN140058 TaxID=1892855 RepID=UPI0010101229|nr:hypothetical protein [Sphingosinicella sp. BN140058]QAY77533.1 hypothetical protein ETR14_14225 [Sphingosinicella sp. BN140058]